MSPGATEGVGVPRAEIGERSPVYPSCQRQQRRRDEWRARSLRTVVVTVAVGEPEPAPPDVLLPAA